MITKPITFVNGWCGTNHIFAITADGEIYYRDQPPFSHTSSTATTPYAIEAAAEHKKKIADDEKKVWKKLLMEYRVDLPKGGPEREAQAANEIMTAAEPADVVIDEPARKIYKDPETVKAVQQALMDKTFYKNTYKVDGDLGKLTADAIKAFQKSIEVKETGEIDFALWAALGLAGDRENETTVEITDGDIVEDESIFPTCHVCGYVGPDTTAHPDARYPATYCSGYRSMNTEEDDNEVFVSA